MRTIKPIWPLVHIEPEARQEQVGSIILTEELGVEKVAHRAGRVIAIPETISSAMSCPVQVGDRVVFRGFLADNNLSGDGDRFLLHQSDIIAIIGDDVDVSSLS